MKQGDFILFREGFLTTTHVKLSDAELAHLKALRLDKVSHLIEIRDGLGVAYLYHYQPKLKEISFESKHSLEVTRRELSLAIALPKGNRLDLFLQKATEIGISRIIFCVFRHSIRRDFNLERAKKIIQEAASQSKQSHLLKVEIADASEWMENEKNRILVFDPHAESKFKISDLKDRIPLVGPEGGFHADEIAWMRKNSIPLVYLQGGILRTETAGIVAATLLAYGN